MDRNEHIHEGEVVQDVTLPDDLSNLTRADLEQLILKAAMMAYEAAEANRQRFQRTPDGLLDKTIRNYKVNDYRTVLSQSDTLQKVEHTGKEQWHLVRPDDTEMIERPSAIEDYQQEIAGIFFSRYPCPLLLEERTDNRDEPE